MRHDIGLKEAIRYVRSERGVSARALSKAANVSPSYISKLESGEIEPSVSKFAAIARALEMTSDEVLLCFRLEAAKLSED